MTTKLKNAIRRKRMKGGSLSPFLSDLSREYSKRKLDEEIKTKIESLTQNVVEEVTPIIRKMVEDNLPNLRGKPGEDGKDYILTNKDKKDIASSIDVPIVEKETETVVEKTVVEKPMITNEIKEVAVGDEPKEIAEKLNTQKEVVEMSVIKNLTEMFEKITREIRRKAEKGGGGGGMGNVQHETFSITNSTTTVTTNFPIAGGGNAIFKAALEGDELHKGTHFTVSGKTIIFASDVQTQFSNLPAGATLNFDITYAR